MTFSSDNKDPIDIGFTLEGDWVADIREMHTKFGVNKVVENLTASQLLDYLKFRIDMMQEELDEAKQALAERDADGIVDAIIDLNVFSIGTLDAFNIDSYEAWARVHEKNMEKEPGLKEGRPNPYGFPDLIKPAGWTAPTHQDNVGLITKAFSQ